MGAKRPKSLYINCAKVGLWTCITLPYLNAKNKSMAGPILIGLTIPLISVKMVSMNLRPTGNPENMELHRAMFKRNGNCGYVPKSGNLLTTLVSIQ